MAFLYLVSVPHSEVSNQFDIEEAYGPKSDGVAPPGSLGGGGRFMRVGPEDLDISFIRGRVNVSGSDPPAGTKKAEGLRKTSGPKTEPAVG